MKRKGMQEILNATKPEDIFTMDLEIIEKEKEEYLSKYKPEEYKAVENSCITKKIVMLYRKAVSFLEENESSEENYTNINFDTNYKLAEEILDSSQKISSEIMNITDKDNINKILEEYYMLQREIMQFEDKLIEMNAIKKAYEKMCLEKQDEIEMTDNDIRMIANMFYEEEEYEKFKTIIKVEKCNPITYILNRICEGGLVIFPAGENTIDIRIDYSDMWLVTDAEYLACTTTHRDGGEQIWIPSGSRDLDIKISNDSEERFVLVIDRHRLECKHYVKEYSFLKYDSYVSLLSRDIYGYDIYGNEKKLKSMKPEEREDIDLKLRDWAKLSVPGKIDKDAARKLIQVCMRIIQVQVMSSEHEYYICDFKSFLTSINMDIKMSNLRNLHSELRNAVRRYKLMM